jgi:hypothetical protein
MGGPPGGGGPPTADPRRSRGGGPPPGGGGPDADGDDCCPGPGGRDVLMGAGGGFLPGGGARAAPPAGTGTADTGVTVPDPGCDADPDPDPAPVPVTPVRPMASLMAAPKEVPSGAGEPSAKPDGDVPEPGAGLGLPPGGGFCIQIPTTPIEGNISERHAQIRPYRFVTRRPGCAARRRSRCVALGCCSSSRRGAIAPLHCIRILAPGRRRHRLGRFGRRRLQNNTRTRDSVPPCDTLRGPDTR